MSDFDFSSRAVLLVDDEGFTRQIVVQLLRSLGYSDVRQASSVSEALGVLGDMERVHVVIADFRMPGDSGLELVKAIRTGNAAINRGTPIAMLTGYSEKSLVEAALALDVNAFLVKPISRNVLGGRLQRLLDFMTDQSWLAPPVVYEQVKTEVALNPWPVGQVKGEGAVQNAPDKVKEVLKRLPALEARFDDTDLSDAIVDSVSHLIEDLGEIDTSNMLAIFDALERHEILSMQEIASMLAVPVKMTSAPEVLLSDSIRTVDGAVLFRAGTRVTRPIAAIMGDLNEVGAITLSEERLRILGLDPTDLPPPVTGSGPRRSGYDPSEGLAMRAVPAGEIQAGDVLARTVFTSDGRLYGKSGAEVTAGMVDVLRDLSELEKIALTLWVEKK